MRNPKVVAAMLAVVLAGCGSSMSDAQRIWCAAEDMPVGIGRSSVVDAARDLGILPSDLTVADGSLGREPIWVPKPGHTARPDGSIPLSDAEINPAVEQAAAAALARWRTTGDYARACVAAYGLAHD